MDKFALQLTAADPVPVPGEHGDLQFLVTDPRGFVRGYITVSELGFGTYGATDVRLCR